MPKDSYNAYFRTALSCIWRLQSPTHPIHSFDRQKSARYFRRYGLPPSIPLGGSKGSVFTTKAGLSAIHKIGRLWRANNPPSRSYVSNNSAGNLAVEVFGEALAIKLFNTHAFNEAKAKYFDLFESRLGSLRQELW